MCENLKIYYGIVIKYVVIILVIIIISSNYFKNKVLKEEIDSKCQLCKQLEEIVDRLTARCPIMVKDEY